MESHLNGGLKAEYCKHKVFAYKRLAALGNVINAYSRLMGSLYPVV